MVCVILYCATYCFTFIGHSLLLPRSLFFFFPSFFPFANLKGEKEMKKPCAIRLLTWRYLIRAYALIFFGSTTITYSLAYFLPIILVESLGFKVGAAQCLVAPPYAFAGFYMFGMGWLGDRYRLRGPIIIANMIMCLIGLPILGWHPNPSIRYLGVFFVTAGANSNVPSVMAYQANNIRGQWKRAFCSATLVGFGGIGGIAGGLVFR